MTGLLTGGLGWKWVLGFEVTVHLRPVRPLPLWAAARSSLSRLSQPGCCSGLSEGREAAGCQGDVHSGVFRAVLAETPPRNRGSGDPRCDTFALSFSLDSRKSLPCSST